MSGGVQLLGPQVPRLRVLPAGRPRPEPQRAGRCAALAGWIQCRTLKQFHVFFTCCRCFPRFTTPTLGYPCLFRAWSRFLVVRSGERKRCPADFRKPVEHKHGTHLQTAHCSRRCSPLHATDFWYLLTTSSKLYRAKECYSTLRYEFDKLILGAFKLLRPPRQA